MANSRKQKATMIRLAKSVGIDTTGINVESFTVKQLSSYLESASFALMEAVAA